MMVDNMGHPAHLHARDSSRVLVSRAPLAKIEPFKKRMGWTIPWYSSFGSDFNYDFGVTTDTVPVVMPPPCVRRSLRPALGRILPNLLPAKRRQVEVAEVAAEVFNTASVGEVGVIDIFAIAQEDA
jgi:hypothetical protein